MIDNRIGDSEVTHEARERGPDGRLQTVIRQGPPPVPKKRVQRKLFSMTIEQLAEQFKELQAHFTAQGAELKAIKENASTRG